MSKPPPPRYRIVERDGRLITIDTWMTGEPSADPLRRRDIVAAGGGIGEAAVALLLRVRDEQDRRLLTTASAWDRKGPRVIALSAKGEQRLGILLVTAAAVALLVVLGVIGNLALLMPIAVVGALVAGMFSSARTGMITRLLDSLGEERQS